jgi:hypothetical protein
MPKFEPTDIVPLLDIAFQQSFTNQKDVLRAIACRGWNLFVTAAQDKTDSPVQQKKE